MGVIKIWITCQGSVAGRFPKSSEWKTCGGNLQKKTRKLENKKTRTQPRKPSRKQESDQEKIKNFLFFLITFLVEFLFSFQPLISANWPGTHKSTG